MSDYDLVTDLYNHNMSLFEILRRNILELQRGLDILNARIEILEKNLL